MRIYSLTEGLILGTIGGAAGAISIFTSDHDSTIILGSGSIVLIGMGVAKILPIMHRANGIKNGEPK